MKKLWRNDFKWIVLVFFLMWVGCAQKTVYFTRSRLMMGHIPVNMTLKIESSQQSAAVEAMDKAYRRALELEAKISEYQFQSEVSCLNRNAGKKFCSLSVETARLIQQCFDLSQKSNQAFDIRFPSLSSEGRQAEIQFDLSSSVIRARLGHPQSRIGLASIGKGFIVDQMLETLKQAGFREALIDAGGDLRALGGPFDVAIQKPFAKPGELATQFKITNRALASAGNYEQEANIRDPRSLKVVKRSQSVSVLAPTLALANPLATAFYVLGPEESKKILTQFLDVEMVWTESTGAVKWYPKRDQKE